MSEFDFLNCFFAGQESPKNCFIRIQCLGMSASSIALKSSKSFCDSNPIERNYMRKTDKLTCVQHIGNPEYIRTVIVMRDNLEELNRVGRCACEEAF